MRNRGITYLISSAMAAALLATASVALAESLNELPPEELPIANQFRYGLMLQLNTTVRSDSEHGETVYGFDSAFGVKLGRFFLGLGAERLLITEFANETQYYRSHFIVKSLRLEGQVAFVRSKDQRVEAFALAAYGWSIGVTPALSPELAARETRIGPIYGGMGIRFWPRAWVAVSFAAGVVGSRVAAASDTQGGWATATLVEPFARFGLSFAVGKR